jgi:hypothetical protein
LGRGKARLHLEIHTGFSRRICLDFFLLFSSALEEFAGTQGFGGVERALLLIYVSEYITCV